MHSSLPLVSVAIITYNQKAYLKEAIESVQQQTYPSIEIIVADDGSTDGTQEMLLDYERMFPGKFVLRLAEKNQGITANTNAAHFACRGKYIAWLGGDDLMYPEKISKQVAYMEAHPECNIVYHNLEVFDSETGNIIRLFNSSREKHSGDVRTAIKHGSFNGACATMVRRSSTPAYGYDPDLKVASDWFHWIETLRYGGTINYMDEVLGKYRRHGNNVSATGSRFFRQGIEDCLLTLDKVARYEEKYPKEIAYARGRVYRSARHIDYRKYLWLSLRHNLTDFRSWIGLVVFVLSFRKIKL